MQKRKAFSVIRKMASCQTSLFPPKLLIWGTSVTAWIIVYFFFLFEDKTQFTKDNETLNSSHGTDKDRPYVFASTNLSEVGKFTLEIIPLCPFVHLMQLFSSTCTAAMRLRPRARTRRVTLPVQSVVWFLLQLFCTKFMTITWSGNQTCQPRGKSFVAGNRYIFKGQPVMVLFLFIFFVQTVKKY